MKKKSVRVFSKGMFSLYCKENKIDDNTVETFNYAIIEILDTNRSKKPFTDHSNGSNTAIFSKKHPNVLVLSFDDIEKDFVSNGHEYKSMSERQGKKIFKFIQNNIDKDKFIVHCRAGISRSGAIGRFIIDFLKYKGYYTYFPEHNNICPNAHVSRILNNLVNKY